MKNQEDSYGSMMRDILKKSMEKPAGWKVYNRQEENKQRSWGIIVFGLFCFMSSIGLWYGLNYLEHFWR